MGWAWALTEDEGIMIHLLRRREGLVDNVMVGYINKAYTQAPVATCDTLSILGHGSRQRKRYSVTLRTSYRRDGTGGEI